VAKTSKIEKMKRVQRLIVQHKAKRDELLAIIRDPENSMQEKLEAQRKMAKLPKNSCSIRHRNRCGVTGRPRGYLRKFNMSRVSFRELALEGKIPGVTKSSW
jgi:small subunit ribosomal protein S14